jgi:hypothetical protein
MSDLKPNILTRERVLAHFEWLASEFDKKSEADESETGLVWIAAAASVRRIMDEVRNEVK